MYKIVALNKAGQGSAVEFVVPRSGEELETELNALAEEGWELRKLVPQGLLLERFGNKKVRARRSHSADNPLDEGQERGLQRQIEDLTITLGERERQLGPDTVQRWDGMNKRLDEMRAQNRRLFDIVHLLAEQLIWCSGAKDFQKGAEAAEGWEKGPRLALEAYRKFMQEE